MTSGSASAGRTSGSHQPLASACPEDREADCEGDRHGREGDRATTGICRPWTAPLMSGSQQQGRDDGSPTPTHDHPQLRRRRSRRPRRGGQPDRGDEQEQPGIGPALVSLNSLPSYRSSERRSKPVLGRRKFLVVLLLHHDRIRRSRRAVERSLFLRRKRVVADSSRSSRVLSARNQPPSSSTSLTWPRTPMSTRAAAKARLSAAHLGDVAHAGGTEVVGRGEKRDDRVPARGSRPARRQAKIIESDEADEAEAADDRRAVVGQPVERRGCPRTGSATTPLGKATATVSPS